MTAEKEILSYVLAGFHRGLGKTLQARPRNGRGGYRFRLPDLEAGKVSASEQPLPPEMRNWRYWIADLTQKDFDWAETSFEYLVDGATLMKLPNIWQFVPALVTPRARDVLERLTPDACHYWPIRFFDHKTERAVERETYIMMPRHWFFVTGYKGIRPETDFPMLYSKTSAALYVELQTNPAALEFVTGLGVFCSIFDRSSLIFEPWVFEGLKDAGVTGLGEIDKSKHTYLNPRKDTEVIGHVWKC